MIVAVSFDELLCLCCGWTRATFLSLAFIVQHSNTFCTRYSMVIPFSSTPVRDTEKPWLFSGCAGISQMNRHTRDRLTLRYLQLQLCNIALFCSGRQMTCLPLWAATSSRGGRQTVRLTSNNQTSRLNVDPHGLLPLHLQITRLNHNTRIPGWC